MNYWVVRIPRHVVKSLKNFPKKDKKRIIEILEEFAVNPWQGDIVKIQGEENLWRRRVGNYRVFYSPHTEVHFVEIKEIERRTSKTY